jgi:hypothetical protein
MSQVLGVQFGSVPFPEIHVLDKVWKSRSNGEPVLGQYFERAEPRRIELSSTLRDTDGTTKRYVVYHEAAHWFRREHVPKKLMKGDDERFANELALYLDRPAFMRKSSPESYARMSALVDKGTARRLKGFAHRMLRKLGGRR